MQYRVIHNSILFLFCITIVSFANCQSIVIQNQNSNPRFINQSAVHIFSNINSNNTRHSEILYNPTQSVDGLQVISTYQPESKLDIVYYLDESGNLHYRSWALSSHLNYRTPSNAYRDSLNPSGAANIGASLMTGILNKIFINKKIRFTVNYQN